jgi:hypothetical protein
MLFECAITSPIADTLLAANHLLHCITLSTRGALSAKRDIDEKTIEVFLREPLGPKGLRVQTHRTQGISKLDTDRPDFLNAYGAMRNTKLASAEAELVWLYYAQLCVTYGARRAFRKALRAGLYFSDQVESPAESLLIARCADLGFEIPHLQVNILDPVSGKHLGRVDGLWASDRVQKGLYQQDTKFGRLLFSRQNGDNDSVVVEFDGLLKYQQDYLGVLEKERQRQNAIGNLGYRFIRINWSDLMQPDKLRFMLVAAKVPKSRHG